MSEKAMRITWKGRPIPNIIGYAMVVIAMPVLIVCMALLPFAVLVAIITRRGVVHWKTRKT